MHYSVEKKESAAGQVTFTISIPFEAQQKALRQAATRLSKIKPIKGFRPGNAPFEIVEKTFGGEALLAESLQQLIGTSYTEIIDKEKIQVVGQPEVSITKQAYGNELEYTAIVSLLPDVKPVDPTTVSLEKQDVAVTKQELEEALKEIQKMRVTESVVERAAVTGDLVEVDFTATVDGVAIENGSAQKYPLVLGDGQMIPGFEDQIVGMNPSDTKTFSLAFPKDYAKDLAGKQAEFSVTVNSVKERLLPALDDALAQSFGQKSIQDLQDLIEKNMLAEKQQKEQQRQEVALLTELVKQSTFGPIPQPLIDNELNRMMHELEHDVTSKGGTFAEYLTHIKKTETQLRDEFSDQAVLRVQTALLTRHLALEHKLAATDEEVDAVIASHKQQYASDKQAIEQIVTPQYRDYITTTVTNKKVIAWLRQSNSKTSDTPVDDTKKQTRSRTKKQPQDHTSVSEVTTK